MQLLCFFGAVIVASIIIHGGVSREGVDLPRRGRRTQRRETPESPRVRGRRGTASSANDRVSFRISLARSDLSSRSSSFRRVSVGATVAWRALADVDMSPRRAPSPPSPPLAIHTRRWTHITLTRVVRAHDAGDGVHLARASARVATAPKRAHGFVILARTTHLFASLAREINEIHDKRFRDLKRFSRLIARAFDESCECVLVVERHASVRLLGHRVRGSTARPRLGPRARTRRRRDRASNDRRRVRSKRRREERFRSLPGDVREFSSDADRLRHGILQGHPNASLERRALGVERATKRARGVRIRVSRPSVVAVARDVVARVVPLDRRRRRSTAASIGLEPRVQFVEKFLLDVGARDTEGLFDRARGGADARLGVGLALLKTVRRRSTSYVAARVFRASSSSFASPTTPRPRSSPVSSSSSSSLTATSRANARASRSCVVARLSRASAPRAPRPRRKSSRTPPTTPRTPSRPSKPIPPRVRAHLFKSSLALVALERARQFAPHASSSRAATARI